MEKLHFGQFVWNNKEGWTYLGMDEDGTIQLCRPIHRHPFQIIEFDQVYVDEFDVFYRENGIKVKSSIKEAGLNESLKSYYTNILTN